MANIASSKKDARRSAERAVRNRGIRSAVKTKVTKVRRAVAEGAAEGLDELTMTAVSALDRAVAKGVLHRNNAARRKARLLKRVGGVASTPAATAAPTAKKAAAKPAPAKKAAAKPAPAKTTARKTAKK